MALIMERKRQLHLVREGKIEAGSQEGQAILQEAFKEDHVLAMQMVEGVAKDHLVRGLKLAGFNSGEIGHLVFSDPSDRAAFFEKERERALRIGAPGHDDFGYPIGFNGGDPFGIEPPRSALVRAAPQLAHAPSARDGLETLVTEGILPTPDDAITPAEDFPDLVPRDLEPEPWLEMDMDPMRTMMRGPRLR